MERHATAVRVGLRRGVRVVAAVVAATVSLLAVRPLAAGDGTGPAAPATDLVSALERAVDLPDPAARAQAAKTLAARPDATVERLVAAMGAFGRFGPEPAGETHTKVPLWDGKAAVETTVHVRVPPGYDPSRPSPLLLALHGAGGDGSAETARWGETADATGMLVVAPTDPGSASGYGYTAAERTTALSALRWARRRFNVDENRIVCTGISRGGHLVWDLALRHPDTFAAIAPMIGGPRLANAKGENNLRFIENLRRMPIRDLQGARDDALLLANLELAFSRLTELGATDARLVVQEGLAHAFDLRVVDWKSWFAAVRRDPAAPEAVRRSVSRADGRSAWIEILGVGKGTTADIRPQVDAKAWSALDDAGRRRTFFEWGEKVTARLFVRRTAPGVFEARAQDVTSFRLLLAEGTFDPARPVTIALPTRTVTAEVRRDPRVLVADFVERFDRTYLPVAEVVVR